MKIALCQTAVSIDKSDNVSRARDMLRRAKDGGADMAILPEMFCIAYVQKYFRDAAEEYPDGEACQMLIETAKETGLTIIGGSIPEIEDGRLYNTSLSFAPDGSLLGKYRKAHLFDIDVPGVFRFMESDTITRGEGYPLIIDKPVKTGVIICFDIRFPEWSRLVMQSGCDLLALPAAFSMNTGPRHWELLMRARALDNQLFVAAVSPARSKSAYGHSMLTSPDGKVIADCGEEEKVGIVELDMGLLEEMRNSIPVKEARRTDLYRLERTRD